MGYYDNRWPEYVSIAERKRKAQAHVASLRKKGIECNPVVIEGRAITKTFWGKAWCDNLENYHDFSNRLPRGRTYVRNGSVIDLQITKGTIKAQVMGSSLYRVTIEVKPIPKLHWKLLIEMCAGKIDSLIELLQGKFSKAVMEILTQKENGLFPQPKEIKMKCSCPDYAGMCKHIAAVLYGVGAILDVKPEWLFDLRHVNQIDLIKTASESNAFIHHSANVHSLEDDELSALFNIEIETAKASLARKPVSVKKIKAKTKESKIKLKKQIKTKAKEIEKKPLKKIQSTPIKKLNQVTSPSHKKKNFS